MPVEYNSALKSKEHLPPAIAWMSLEDIMSSETNQTQRDGCVWSHVWNLKRPEVSVSQMVLQLIAVSCVFVSHLAKCPPNSCARFFDLVGFTSAALNTKACCAWMQSLSVTFFKK